MADFRLIQWRMEPPLNKRFSMRINDRELEAFKKAAARKRIPFGVAVRIAMWEWLKKANPKSALPHPQGNEVQSADPAQIVHDERAGDHCSPTAAATAEADQSGNKIRK